MNRTFAAFSGFIFLLVVVAVFALWWLGPRLVMLAFDSDRSGTPFYALILRDVASEGPDAYGSQIIRLLVEDQAQLFWRAHDVAVINGAQPDEWDRFDVAKFPAAAQFVRFATSQEYRDLQNGAPGSAPVVVGTSDVPLGTFRHPTQLLLMARSDRRSDLEPWLQDMRSRGAELLWDAQIEVYSPGAEGQIDWNLLMVLGFEGTESPQQWLFSAEAQTSQALLQTRIGTVNLWLLQDLTR